MVGKTIMDEVIKTENLVKYFGKTHAVDDISINVEKGEIYGFLGLNGAGKTTVIRMLLGMIKPTEGKVYLHDTLIKAGINSIWKKVGYLVETPYAYPDLTVKENLEVIRKLRGIDNKSVVTKVMEDLRLSRYQNILAKNLSLGNAQRLGIAKALMHDPEILFLDEPANGLDPVGIVEIRELLKELAHKKGVTIFISSHILGEVSKFANRIGIIHQGKLVKELKTTELKNHLMKKLCISTRDVQKMQSILVREGYSPVISQEGFLEMTDEKAINAPDQIATLLVKENVPPTMLKIDEEDLESFFLRTISQQEVVI